MIIIIHTVDGRNPAPVEVGSLSHYLQGFYTSKLWLFGISEPSTVPSVQKLLASAAHFAGWGLYRSFLLGGKKWWTLSINVPRNPEPNLLHLLPSYVVCGCSPTIDKQIHCESWTFWAFNNTSDHFYLAKGNKPQVVNRRFSSDSCSTCLELYVSNRSLEQLLRASRKSHSRKSQWIVGMAWSQWRSSSPSLANRTSIWAAILETPFFWGKFQADGTGCTVLNVVSI